VAFTAPTLYPKMINALIKGHSKLLNRINSNFVVPGGSQAGAISVDVLSSISTADIVDGTMLTSGATNVLTALTFVNKSATVSLLPGQLKSLLKNADAMKAYLVSAADAIYQAAMNSIVADEIAGTPGKQVTLTAGQIDFATDGTDAEIRENLGKIGELFGYMLANKTDAPLTDFYILTTATGFGNLLSYTDQNVAGTGLRFNEAEGRLYFRGVPIYAVTGPAAWGGASQHALIMCHKTAIALKFEDVYMHGGGWIPASDGTTKAIFVGPYAHGVVIGDLMAEIMNPSS